VPLVPRLEHPRARAGHDDLVAEQGPERAPQHVGVLVLPVVVVQRRGQRARRERVVDDRELPARLRAVDLPVDAEPAEVERRAVGGLQDDGTAGGGWGVGAMGTS
jgi:hypothetical protein